MPSPSEAPLEALPQDRAAELVRALRTLASKIEEHGPWLIAGGVTTSYLGARHVEGVGIELLADLKLRRRPMLDAERVNPPPMIGGAV
jgi:hypothetical protein